MRNSTVDSFTTSATNRINPPFFSRASACIDLHKYFFFFYFSRNNRYFVVGRGPLNQARLSVLTFRQTEGLKTTLVNFCQFSLKNNKKLITSRYSYFCEIFFVKYSFVRWIIYDIQIALVNTRLNLCDDEFRLM